MKEVKNVEIEEVTEKAVKKTARKTKTAVKAKAENDTSVDETAAVITADEPTEEEKPKTVKKTAAKKTAKKTTKKTAKKADEKEEEPASPEAEETKPPRKARSKSTLKAVEKTALEKESRKEVVIDMQERGKIRRQNVQEREEKVVSWAQIKGAFKAKVGVSGVVAGVEPFNEHICAIVFLSQHKVLIPFDDFYSKPAIDMKSVNSKENLLRRQKQMLNRVIGAEITFFITQVKEEGKGKDLVTMAAGSRKMYLEEQIKKNFNPDENLSKVKVGDRVEAKIISSGEYGVFANIQGYDLSIPRHALTCRYCPTVHLEPRFNPGNTIKVDITKIEFDDDGKLKELAVSAIKSEVEEMAKNQSKVVSGGTYLGTVVTVLRGKDNQPSMRLHLSQVDLPAIVTHIRPDTMFRTPKTGDTVLFSLYEKLPNGYVTGTVLRIVSEATI